MRRRLRLQVRKIGWSQIDVDPFAERPFAHFATLSVPEIFSVRLTVPEGPFTNVRSPTIAVPTMEALARATTVRSSVGGFACVSVHAMVTRPLSVSSEKPARFTLRDPPLVSDLPTTNRSTSSSVSFSGSVTSSTRLTSGLPSLLARLTQPRSV